MKINPMASTIAALTLAISIFAMTTMELSKVNYDRVEKGMSYVEVKKIIGREGKILSESESENFKVVMYSWERQEGDKADVIAGMTAMFENDKLTSKSQYGLK